MRNTVDGRGKNPNSRKALQEQGKPIGDADVLIDAYCVVNDYTLVTNNTSVLSE